MLGRLGMDPLLFLAAPQNRTEKWSKPGSSPISFESLLAIAAAATLWTRSSPRFSLISPRSACERRLYVIRRLSRSYQYDPSILLPHRAAIPFPRQMPSWWLLRSLRYWDRVCSVLVQRTNRARWGHVPATSIQRRAQEKEKPREAKKVG